MTTDIPADALNAATNAIGVHAGPTLSYEQAEELARHALTAAAPLLRPNPPEPYENHRPYEDGTGSTWCVSDDMAWPCEVATAYAAGRAAKTP